jgi:hypothetical protein
VKRFFCETHKNGIHQSKEYILREFFLIKKSTLLTEFNLRKTIIL